MLEPVGSESEIRLVAEVQTLRRQVATELDRLLGKDQPQKLALAVSGGRDSVALLLLASEWARDAEAEILVLTVDHGLRPTSKSEADQVAEWTEALGHRHRTLSWTGDKPTRDIQARARAARYALLQQACLEENIDVLCLGHQRDDQIETVMMRLEAKSGLRGLAGIAASRNLQGLRIMRPLLTINRLDLRRYLERVGQEWIDDPSNEDLKFARIEIRKRITHSESSGNMRASISQLHQLAASFREKTDRLAKSAAHCFCTLHESGFLELEFAKWAQLPTPLAEEVLSQALLSIGGDRYAPKISALRRLATALKEPNSGRWRTLAHCAVRRTDSKLQIIREQRDAPASKPIPQSGVCIWGNYVIDCRENRWLAGQFEADSLYVSALGESGYRSILRDEPKISSELSLPTPHIHTLPSLKYQEKIVFVPFLRFMDHSLEMKLGKTAVQFVPRHDFYDILAVVA